MRSIERLLGAVFACACAFGTPAPALAAGIAPDGGTATTVSGAAGTRQTVNIAPAVGGVSHNTYSSFNVERPGADLVNSGVNARVIVNEVTSTSISRIEGPIEVLGPRANVVIANPNGITVNGGAFVNVGSAALATARVELRDIAGGAAAQRNVILHTNQGAIDIGNDGLSGTFNSLELIAKSLRIDGPVVNEFDAARARIRAVVGASRAEIDGGVAPVDGVSPWISYASPGAADPGRVAVDITALGSLRAGRIEVVVTDQGAGVRHAGAAIAALGSFSLSATGDVQIAGGTIGAQDSIVIDARDIEMTPAAGRAATMLAAEGGVLLRAARDFRSTGGLVQGARSITGLAESKGAVTVIAGRDVLNQTTADSPLAVLFGRDDDVVIEAGGDVVNRSGRIVANGALDIAAAGDVVNVLEASGGAAERTEVRNDTRNFFGLPRKQTVTEIGYGALTGSPETPLLVGNDGVRIGARALINRGGEIDALAGSIKVIGTGAVVNEAVVTGSARIERVCRFFGCRTSASSDMRLTGGALNANDRIEITAPGGLTNAGGRFFATNDIMIDAPQVIARGMLLQTALERPDGLKAAFGASWAALYAADQGGSFTSSFGRLLATGTFIIDGAPQPAVISIEAAGGVTILRQPRRDPVQITNHIGVITYHQQ